MSKMMRLFLTLCLLATMALSIAADGRQRARKKMIAWDKNFSLSVGQAASSADGQLRIKLVSVPEDSRCPKGVNCIWAGNARVRLEVGKAVGKPARFDLNTNPREATDVAENSFGRYSIKLVGVAPYPVSGHPIAPGSYTATLVVSKKS